MRAQVRTQQPTRYGTNQQGTHEIGIDIAEPEMQQASHSGEYHGVDNVGAHHDLRREAVEQKQEHHDDAARAYRSHAHQTARQ